MSDLTDRLRARADDEQSWAVLWGHACRLDMADSRLVHVYSNARKAMRAANAYLDLREAADLIDAAVPAAENWRYFLRGLPPPFVSTPVPPCYQHNSGTQPEPDRCPGCGGVRAQQSGSGCPMGWHYGTYCGGAR